MSKCDTSAVRVLVTMEGASHDGARVERREDLVLTLADKTSYTEWVEH